MNRLGRPPKQDGSVKNGQYRLRLSDEEAGMLDYISGKTGESKADILRNALKMQYNLTRCAE